MKKMTAFAAAAVDYTILQYNQEVTCLSIEVIIFLFSHLQLLSPKGYCYMHLTFFTPLYPWIVLTSSLPLSGTLQ